MDEKNLNPVFHLMGEMGMNSFVLLAIDERGCPTRIHRSSSPAASRALRGYMEDWVVDEDELAASRTMFERKDKSGE